MWVITNIINETFDLPFVYRTEFYSFFSDKSFSNSMANDSFKWYVTGHIFPRNNVYIKSTVAARWLSELFEKEGPSYIKYIKGNFVLIQYNKYGFRVYSDRFAIRKFFYWRSLNEFIISDRIENILRTIHTKPSPVSMAIYAVTYHFTGGRTLFNDVFHNEPGQVISLHGKAIAFDHYWNPNNLLSLPKTNVDIKNITAELTNSLLAYLNKTGNERISLSLTGGADTRNLLAIFLKSGVYPHLYTYGDPQSVDCIKAQVIAKGLNLNHSIHDINMDKEVFEDYGKRIIHSSGGLCSFHRAHRLIAIEKERKFAEYMFLGTLGGEFIKGVSEDNYIIPEIVYKNWNVDFNDPTLINKYFISRFLANNDTLKKEVHSFLKNEPYLNGNKIQRKLNALSYITAHLHDAQDLNLFCSVMEDVFTPFIDIDYLELIFSSRFTFNIKEESRCNLIRKINNPVYGAMFLNVTYPELLKYKYSGEHRGDEVLFNKYIAAIIKLIRLKKNGNYKANFPLGMWMLKFVETNLLLCNDYDLIKETYDIDKMIKYLRNGNIREKESDWIKFTNPIMMRYIIDHYPTTKYEL